MKIDDLEIVRRSKVLANDIHSHVAAWSAFDLHTLGLQMVRSADSVASKLAEGWGRYSTADHLKFVRYARGSIMKLRAQVDLAEGRKLLSADVSDELRKEIESLYRMMVAYSKSLPQRMA
jgi:four helix bundle protein